MDTQAIKAFAEGFRSILDFKGLAFGEPGSPGAEQNLGALCSQALDIGGVKHG